LVDDDDSLRRALVRALRIAGYDVDAFRNAEDVAAANPSWTQACLVLDVDLPGMDGVTFRHSLAAAGSDVPTVFITAFDRYEMNRRLCGSSTVLHKPFRNDDLLRAIDRACHA